MTTYELLAQYGKNELARLFVRDLGLGGNQCLVIGTPGTGKTSILIHFALSAYNLGDTVIWLGREIDQFWRIPNWEKLCEFYAHENDIIRLKKIDKDGIHQLNIPIHTYRNARDLFHQFKKHKINVVFHPTMYIPSSKIAFKLFSEAGIRREELQLPLMGNTFWYELFYVAIHKENLRWYSFIFDECDDLWAANQQNPYWKLIEWNKNVFKHFRKNLISLYASTHGIGDLDYRILRKFMVKLYLSGSTPTKNSIVSKRLIARLATGEAVIEGKKFGLIKFKFVPTPTYQVKVEIMPNWQKWEKLKPHQEEVTQYVIKIHREAIIQVAKENGGYIRRQWVEAKLLDQFNRTAYYKVLKEMTAEGLLELVKRGVWRLKIV